MAGAAPPRSPPIAWLLPLLLLAPSCAPPAAPAGDDPLPYRYYLVGPVAAPGLSPGWGVAVISETTGPGGQRYARTRGGHDIAMSRLRPPPSIALRGAELDGDSPDDRGTGTELGGDLGLGFVIEDRVPVYAQPSATAPPVESRARFDRIRVLPGAPPGWIRVDAHLYLRAADAAVPRRSARPPEVGSGERWLDVDRASQTLVAYQGDRPRYAALVSTGSDAHPTPAGVRRIQTKLRAADMDNLEKPTDGDHYFVEAVPYVQYLGPNIALHGAFWHRRFGHVHSHGCINLAPYDARWLFAFTAPSLRAEQPEASGPGTVVRVR